LAPNGIDIGGEFHTGSDGLGLDGSNQRPLN